MSTPARSKFFVKTEIGLNAHEAVVCGGHSAAHVFWLALQLAREADNDGSVKASRLTPMYLRRRFLIDDDLPDAFLARGLATAVEHGLLEADGESYRIPSWSKHYEPRSAPVPVAERVSKHRAGKRAPRGPKSATPAGDVTECNDGNVTYNAGNECNDVTPKKRGEEKREEENRSASASPPLPAPAPTHDAQPRAATPATGGSGSDGEAGRHPGETTPPKSSTPPWVYYGHVEETDPPDRKAAGVKSLWLELDGSRPNLSMGDDVAIERWVTTWPFKAVLYAIRRALELDGHRIGNRHVSGILQRARPEEWDEAAREAAAAAEPQRAAGGARDGAGERACPQSRINASWAEKSAQAPARAAEAMADPNWGIVDPRAGF